MTFLLAEANESKYFESTWSEQNVYLSDVIDYGASTEKLSIMKSYLLYLKVTQTINNTSKSGQ